MTKPPMSLGFALCLFLLVGAAAVEASPSAALTDTRFAVEKWVETRQTIARTQADWTMEKETLANTLELFQRESKTLGEQMVNVRTNVTQAQKEMTKFDDEKALLGAALDKAKELAERFETRVQTMVPQWPAPLVSKIDPLLKKIPEDAEETKRSVLERMQNVVGIVNEVDKFNGSVTLESEVQRNPSGADIQVRTLYLGLGQAYFVDKSGTYAGLGVPGPDGWQWTSRPELGPAILNAIGVYENSRPAVFVALPVQIK